MHWPGYPTRIYLLNVTAGVVYLFLFLFSFAYTTFQLFNLFDLENTPYSDLHLTSQLNFIDKSTKGECIVIEHFIKFLLVQASYSS